jgi:hypothetical protein
MTTATRETCRQCGKEWCVTTEPRESVLLLCSACSHTPRLPEGEVRRSPDGTTAVCLGSDCYARWKVIGEDPHRVVTYGWRADRDVVDWQRTGNVYDLTEAGQ